MESGLKLAEDLSRWGADGVVVDGQRKILDRVSRQWQALSNDAPHADRQALCLEARWAVRRMALVNPLLDFRDIVFVKRAPTKYTCNCDQYLGWWSQPGGGLYVLKDFKGPSPTLLCLTANLPPGNVLDPDLSYDGTRVLFAYCRYYPGLSENGNKLDKGRIAEDAFYKLHEVRLDGTGLRRLLEESTTISAAGICPTAGSSSSRRGEGNTCSTRRPARRPRRARRCPIASSVAAAARNGRVASTLCTSWTGMVVTWRRCRHSRCSNTRPTWMLSGGYSTRDRDYVDRHRVPCISLWSTLPDGSNPREVFGNYLPRNPHCIFEARAIPDSRKLVFVASAHHGATGGSLVLLDPDRGADAVAAMTRLTPEVPFPESEAVPTTYFADPYPLSEEHYLVSWSDVPPVVCYGGPMRTNAINALGIYLMDCFGNLNLIYRDPEISSAYPLPVRRTNRPAPFPSVAYEGDRDGEVLVVDVHKGLEWLPRGSVRQLRIVGIPSKTHPTMNYPSLGVTGDDPGKFVLGTTPVEADGSAHFRVPCGVPFFVQALDADGFAVQTMRSATYLPPGKTFACIGCHEPRNTAPPNTSVLAARREAARLVPGPEGSWPLDFLMLIQPVLDKHCVHCHRPEGEGRTLDLTAAKSYGSLVGYGNPSLAALVRQRYNQLLPSLGPCAAQASSLVKLLKKDHYDCKLGHGDWERLLTWIDTYSQRSGSFGPDQEQRIEELRQQTSPRGRRASWRKQVNEGGTTWCVAGAASTVGDFRFFSFR